MRGGAWYLNHRDYDIQEMRAWCKENLTPGSWFINENMSMGVFEVCVGIDVEVVGFILLWL